MRPWLPREAHLQVRQHVAGVASDLLPAAGGLAHHPEVAELIPCNPAAPGEALPGRVRWLLRWLGLLRGTLHRIRTVALSLGLTTHHPAYYNNLSLETMPADKIYRKNMEWLSRVKKEYDPEDVMGRAGGHKIPLPCSGA